MAKVEKNKDKNGDDYLIRIRLDVDEYGRVLGKAYDSGLTPAQYLKMAGLTCPIGEKKQS